MEHDHKLSEQYLNSDYRKFFDLAYGTVSEDQKLDLWLPRQSQVGPYPVILYFHGGAFCAGDKREDQSEPVLRFLECGFAVADVAYRKSGEATFPAMLYDAKSAVRFLRASSVKYDLDPARFAAWGSSCGGWIVGMLGVTGEKAAFQEEGRMYPEQSDAVQAVVDWCGPCGNFLQMDPDLRESGAGTPDHTPADSPEGRFMGACLTDIPDRCAFAAPVTHVDGHTPPTLILHGTADPVVPIQQSRRFYDAITRAAGPERAEFHELSHLGHHGKPWNDDPAVEKYTMEFLKRVLNR
jgi:acetyl esterase/lipase